MKASLSLASICSPSASVIAREIDGASVIVPLALEAEEGPSDPIVLNEVGAVIWKSLSGRVTLSDVVDILATEFGIPRSTLEADVVAFAVEAAVRGILVAAK